MTRAQRGILAQWVCQWCGYARSGFGSSIKTCGGCGKVGKGR